MFGDLSQQQPMFLTKGGIINCNKANTIFAASFVCASATVRLIKQSSPSRVTFLTTEPGLEDQACGEYMAGLLQGKAPNLSSMLSDIRKLGDERTRELVCKGTISKLQGENIMNELEYCLAVDKFNFAMVVHRKNGLLKLKPVF